MFPFLTDTTSEAASALASDVADNLNTEASTAKSALQSVIGNLSLSRILAAVIVLLVCILVTKLVLRTVDHVSERFQTDKALHAFTRSAVKVLLMFLTIMLFAQTLGINTSSLLALLSVAGLAISLSIQNTLSNMASAVLIMITKPFHVGDYIEFEDYAGEVLQIGMIYTRIFTIDHETIMIPNSKVTDSKITNCTAEGRSHIKLTVSASYDAPVETVKKALLDAADCDGVLTDPKPAAHLVEYGESAISYCLFIWTTTENYHDVYFHVRERVFESFQKYGISMTYPHMNVHIVEPET